MLPFLSRIITPVLFSAFDFLAVNSLLLWESGTFSVGNLKNALAPTNFDYRTSLIDWWLLSLTRLSVICGFAGALLTKRSNSIRRLKSLSLLWLLLPCIAMALLSPIKLVAVSEIPHELTARFWLLFVWNIVACGSCMAICYRCFMQIQLPLGAVERLVEDEPENSQNSTGKKSAESAEKMPTARLVRQLLGYWLTQWPYYTAAFLFLILYSVARIFIPYYIGKVISDVVLTRSYEHLIHSVILMIGLSLASASCGCLRGSLFSYTSARVNREIRHDLFRCARGLWYTLMPDSPYTLAQSPTQSSLRSLMSQEMGFFDERKTGEIISRLTSDCQTVTLTLGRYSNLLLRNMLMLIGSFAVMFSLSWRLALFTLIAMPSVTVAVRGFGIWYDALYEKQQAALADATDHAQEALTCMRTLRSFAGERFESERYRGKLTHMLAVARSLAFVLVGDLWVSELFTLLLQVGVLWYGGHLVLTDRLSGDGLIAFLLYEIQLGGNLEQLTYVYGGLMQTVGASRKVFEYIARKPLISNDGTLMPADCNCKGEIEFRNVSFAYPIRPETKVLDDVSFKVTSGETVALVGPSGGGKSSCIALLEHFYEPQQGQVLLDGVEVEQIDHKYLHSRVALVGQEPVLFGTSVAENIAYGLDAGSVSREAVEEAAKLANAFEFVTEMRLGFETQVGEKGVQLSGGQKQRIAIARALIRQPKVLLLDEATSALDSKSERLVQTAIYRNLVGHTVVIIAHRLSTVEMADRIVVIDRGRVVQQGKHEELLAVDGLYKNLVHRQLREKDN